MTTQEKTLDDSLIKPILYLFDNDQIYDLLMFDRVHNSILSLLKSALSDHCFSSNKQVVLIQRYSIYNSDWADEWITKFYEWIKPLTKTWILDNGEINGKDYGFEPSYKANFPSSLNLGTFPSQIMFKVPKGETAMISWLGWTYKENPVDLDNAVSVDVSDWSRYSQQFTASKDNDLEVTLDSSKWLFNSCVITGKATIFDNSGLVLYKSLDNTLSRILGKLQLTACQVLTGITATVKTDLQVFEGCRKYPMYIGNFGVKDPYHGLEKITFSAPVFQYVPDSYFYATLIYANNDYWRKNKDIPSQDIKADLGKKLTIYHDKDNEIFNIVQSDTYGFFNKWRDELAEKNPQG